MTETAMPIPIPHQDNKEYWEGCKRHELLIQRCVDCGTFRYPPRPGCHNCASLNKEWVKVSGKGVIYSYTIVHFPVHPATVNSVPYNVVLVELPDAGGIRLVSNVDCRNEGIYIGMAVGVVWDDVSREVTLPKFKPRA